MKHSSSAFAGAALAAGMISIFSTSVFAQAPAGTGASGVSSPAPTPYPTRSPMWRCDLPGGTYEVAIRNMMSVSIHEYVVDGAAKVTEMNVETPGAVEVRFYYLEPLTPTAGLSVAQSAIDKVQSLANEAADKLNPGEEPPWEKVVKSYPTTTHAHTVEFRLDSLEDLQSLFNSAEQAFRMNQNTEIMVEGGPGGGQTVAPSAPDGPGPGQ
jgi:hypothetical protein